MRWTDQEVKRVINERRRRTEKNELREHLRDENIEAEGLSLTRPRGVSISNNRGIFTERDESRAINRAQSVFDRMAVFHLTSREESDKSEDCGDF